MTLPEHFYRTLYAWATKTLASADLPHKVIQSHQNAPAPKEPYLAIQYAPELQPLGYWTGDAVEEESRETLYQYTAIVSLWEVGGGDALRVLLESLVQSKTVQAFQRARVHYMSASQITQIPSLIGEKWVKEQSVVLQFGVATRVEEMTDYIETVSIRKENEDE